MGQVREELYDAGEGVKLSIKDYLVKKYPGEENKYFVGRMLEYLDRCENTQQRIFTDFLDPLKVKIAAEMSRHCNGSCINFYGGFEEAERRIAAVSPEWDRVKLEEYPVVLLKITDKGWGKGLNHRDYLGALLGLGIKRDKIGDLLVRDRVCLAAVHQDIVGFVEMNLERAGNSRVDVERVYAGDPALRPEFKEIRVTVASPRLDGVVGAVFGLSREKSSRYINGEKVRVNWEVCIRPDIALKEGDIVSVRGEGKFKVQGFTGLTKKGRTIIHIDRYV
ncbi:MAG: RNA-binding protein [Firmicutes bacterium]|nr:YlmH/Sll1252 family protein [Bacillota bacterium]NSW92129.1 RNA-binding protein [Bacillota bacterium]